MNLSERIGELFITAYQGKEPDSSFLEQLREHSIGGIILFADNCEEHARLAQVIERIQQPDSPHTLIAIDQEGGRVCRLKGKPAEYRSAAEYLALAKDPPGDIHSALNRYRAEFGAAAEYISSLGINFLLGPIADLELWSGDTALAGRTFGSDPALASRFICETIRVAHKYGLACCLKHAPGLGRLSADPHSDLSSSSMTERQFDEIDSIPFRAGIEAGAGALMSSHFLLPEFDSEPVTFSGAIINGLIRNKLGFAGALVTDDLNMGALEHFGGSGEIVLRAFMAGHDILLTRNMQTAVSGIAALQRALSAGEITESRLSESLTRVDLLRKSATGKSEQVDI